MQKKRVLACFWAVLTNLFFKSRLFGGISFMVAQATGFKLYAPPGKKAAYPAYAFVGYLELLGQKPLGVFESGDLPILHLPFEGLPGFGRNTLAFATGLSNFAKRLQSLLAVSIEPTPELTLGVAQHLSGLAPAAAGAFLQQSKHLKAIGYRTRRRTFLFKLSQLARRFFNLLPVINPHNQIILFLMAIFQPVR
jgi:hypothetical protein